MIIDYVLTHGGAPTQRRCALYRRRQGHNKPHTPVGSTPTPPTTPKQRQL
nr:MAG TPA: hypothetical protein [Caudoviricetes sp.]